MEETEDLAKGYTLVNDTQYNAGLFLLKKLNILPGQRVLDVGCGPGNITGYIATLVGATGSVTGIDPSHERINIARQTPQLKLLTNLSFQVGRAEDLSMLPSHSFDVVYVNSTFHWIHDQTRAISEFARVLKPGGISKLGISGGSGDFTAVHETIKATVLSRDPYRDFASLMDQNGPKFLKRREIEELLDNAGFSSREIVVNTIVKRAENSDAMIDWLDTSSSGKTYGGISLDLRPRARREMKEEWEKYVTDDDDGGIEMVLELYVTVAVRD